MTDRHDARSWESFLPPVYNWLESLKVTTDATPSPDSWIVIPCLSEPSFELCHKGISDGLAAQIKAKVEDLKWKKKGQLTLQVDEFNILLLGFSGLNVSPLQKGREVGLEAAKFFKDLDSEGISFTSNDDVSVLSILEGFWQGLYTQAIFKGEQPKSQLPENIGIIGHKPSKDAIDHSISLSRAVLFAMTLQDAPANWLNPEKWASIAETYFKSRTELTILSEDGLKKESMGSFLSVGAGSVGSPKLISIKIKGKNSKKSIALVGKGLTFDAGGISLKPSAGMGEMKYDMSGGAAVMGAAHYLSNIQPDVDVHCLIGAVENMPSSKATRPGDIVQARNGKTIEVLNTDAEGRLVLADLLSYASDEKRDLIVDLATLTGAVLHGLGQVGAAVMTNHRNVAELLLKSGQKTGEPLWELPLWEELKKEVTSDVADLKNIAKPSVMAGSIIGGIFLNEFVPKETQWAHMDIAGTGWNCLATGYPKSGGCGFGVRTLVEVCTEFNL